MLQTILTEHDAGRRVALCVVVATRGSTPQPAGALVCVDDAANVIGTLGGGCVEADVRRHAYERLSAASGQLLTFKLDADFGYDDGMICGGEMDVAICPLHLEDDLAPYRTAATALKTGAAIVPVRIERDQQQWEYRVRIEAAPRLLIAGAGHISRVLADVTRRIGFEVNVFDDRSDYANERRFPRPVIVHVGDIGENLKEQVGSGVTYVVIVTRGHKNDEAALAAVLGSQAAYIGMIGSRRKINVIFDDLRPEGFGEAEVAAVHAPIGLSIGAVTTDEIAISIAAELISVHRANRLPSIEGPFPVETP